MLLLIFFSLYCFLRLVWFHPRNFFKHKRLVVIVRDYIGTTLQLWILSGQEYNLERDLHISETQTVLIREVSLFLLREVPLY